MSEPASPPIVLLGISGGIAAYKAVTVASRLQQAGCEVHVALTPAATQFVTPLTFSAVIHRRAQVDMFAPTASDSPEDLYAHLSPTTRARQCVLLPATADLIARVAAGMGDDLVTTGVLALPENCHRFFCPAMNVNMWRQPVVQENVRRLEAAGWQRIGPAGGMLACGTVGEGRMTEPEEILERLLLDLRATPVLPGRRVLILSGPTVEHLDPVRFLSNHSSGKMGRALALAAAGAGATVDFVSGPVPAANLPRHPLVTVHPVTSAREMLAAAETLFPTAAAAVFAAAVADYAPASPAATKLPKSEDGLTLTLVPNPDIAATLSVRRRPGQVCLGFALETADGLAKASAKLARKHLDGIVLNSPDSFGADEGGFTFIRADRPTPDDWGRLSKDECASRLVQAVAELLNRTPTG